MLKIRQRLSGQCENLKHLRRGVNVVGKDAPLEDSIVLGESKTDAPSRGVAASQHVCRMVDGAGGAGVRQKVGLHADAALLNDVERICLLPHLDTNGRPCQQPFDASVNLQAQCGGGTSCQYPGSLHRDNSAQVHVELPLTRLARSSWNLHCRTAHCNFCSCAHSSRNFWRITSMTVSPAS